MLFALLDEVTEGSGTGSGTGSGFNPMLIILLVLIVAMIPYMIYSSRKNKKQQQENQNRLNAIKPGNKVTTIGGICGIVVEINEEDDSFVLETGTETTGKSYIKLLKQSIYQTDAVAPTADEKSEQSFESTTDSVVEEGTEEVKEDSTTEEQNS